MLTFNVRSAGNTRGFQKCSFKAWFTAPSKCLFVFRMANVVFLREEIRQDLGQMVVTCLGLRHVFAWGAHPLPRQGLYLEGLMFSRVLAGFQHSHKPVHLSQSSPPRRKLRDQEDS